MLVIEQPHDDLKRPIRDPSAATQEHACSLRDKALTVHEHDPFMIQRRGPCLPIWTIIILVSIVSSFLFIFPRTLPSWPYSFLGPCLSDAMSQIPSDATSDEMVIPSSTSPAFSSNGRTDQVQWDSYTLVLRGQRVLI
jgi:hypothetical protein